MITQETAVPKDATPFTMGITKEPSPHSTKIWFPLLNRSDRPLALAESNLCYIIMDIQATTVTEFRHILHTYSEDGSSSFLCKFSTYQTTRCHIPDDRNLKIEFIPSILQISIQQKICLVNLRLNTSSKERQWLNCGTCRLFRANVIVHSFNGLIVLVKASKHNFQQNSYQFCTFDWY